MSDQYEFQDAFGTLRVVSEPDLRELAAKGEIHTDTLVRKAGGMNWAKARVVQGLAFAPHTSHLGPSKSKRHGAGLLVPPDSKRWRSVAWYACLLRVPFAIVGLLLLASGLMHATLLGLSSAGISVDLPQWTSGTCLLGSGETGAPGDLTLAVRAFACGFVALFFAVSSRALQLHASAKATELPC